MKKRMFDIIQALAGFPNVMDWGLRENPRIYGPDDSSHWLGTEERVMIDGPYLWVRPWGKDMTMECIVAHLGEPDHVLTQRFTGRLDPRIAIYLLEVEYER